MDKFLKIFNDTSALVMADPFAVWIAGGAAILLGLLLMLINIFKVARIRSGLNIEIQARTKLNAQLDSAEQQIQQFQDEISHQNQALAQLEKDKQVGTQRMIELSDKLTAQQTALVTVEQQLTQSAVQLKEQSEMITGLQQSVTQQKEQSVQITELQQALATQNLKNTQLSNQLAQHQEQTSSEQKAVDARITELAQQLEQASHDINNLAAQQPGHSGDQLKQVEQDLKAKLHEKDLAFENLRSKLASLDMQPTQVSSSLNLETVSVTAAHEAETTNEGRNEPSYTDAPAMGVSATEPVMTEAESSEPTSKKKGWKGIFGGKTKTQEIPAVEETPTMTEVAASQPVMTQEEPVKPVSQKKGWKGMFGGKAKGTDSSVEEAPPAPELTAPEPVEPASKKKGLGLFGRKAKAAEHSVVEETPAFNPDIVEAELGAEIEKEPVKHNYVPTVAEDLQQAKAQLKGLFGKFGGSKK